MFKTKRTLGMTLIELMFALTLSGLIIGAIFEIYFSAEKNRQSQQDVIVLQKNAYTVTQLLKEYVRRTAYLGCAKLATDFAVKNNKITRYENHDVKPGTDAIRVEYFNPRNLSLLQSMQGLMRLHATYEMRVKEGEEWMISDCQSAETFRVRKVLQEKGGQTIVPNKALAKSYEKNAMLNKVESDVIFISASQESSKGLQRYGLYKKNNIGEKIEWVSGVDAMHVTYTSQENQQLVEHPLTELHDATAIKSLSFTLQLHAGSLHKPWYVYVALP